MPTTANKPKDVSIKLSETLVKELRAEAKALGVPLKGRIEGLIALGRGTSAAPSWSVDELENVSARMLAGATRSSDIKNLTDAMDKQRAMRRAEGEWVERASVMEAQEQLGAVIDNALSSNQAADWGVSAEVMERLRQDVRQRMNAVWE